MKSKQPNPNHQQNPCFSIGQVDQLQALDLESITREDLILQYRTGHSIARTNSQSKKYSYRNGVKTKLGDIERSVWITAAKYVIKRDGLEEEAEHLREFFADGKSASPGGLRSEPEEILNDCLAGLYQSPIWVGFVPYNQRYHPEVLERAHLVLISSACCQKPGYVTEEQITQSYENRVACPICGSFSHFKRLS